jgi:hypothetical protein
MEMMPGQADYLNPMKKELMVHLLPYLELGTPSENLNVSTMAL